MRLAAKSLLAAAMILSAGSPALAVTPLALGAGGRTVAGPGTVTMPKGAPAMTVMSNYFAIDSCVTVVNAGPVDLTVDTTGTGTGQAIVPALQSTSLCQAALTTVTLTCSGAQLGLCHGIWRVDR